MTTDLGQHSQRSHPATSDLSQAGRGPGLLLRPEQHGLYPRGLGWVHNLLKKGMTRRPDNRGAEEGDGAWLGPLLTAAAPLGAPGRTRHKGSRQGDTRRDRSRKVQVSVSKNSSVLSNPLTPPQPPPRALWPRIRSRSHFRHRRRPERKYLSRDTQRQGCGGGAPP